MVRVAPNELVFITPTAYMGVYFEAHVRRVNRGTASNLCADIYTSTVNGRPAFVKSDLLDTGDEHEGLASERDIDRHRASRRQLAPAFSPRALKQNEPTIHSRVDEFVRQLHSSPATHEGINISPVLDPTAALSRM